MGKEVEIIIPTKEGAYPADHEVEDGTSIRCKLGYVTDLGFHRKSRSLFQCSQSE